MEISMNISTQINENIENFKKAIADTSDQVKKNKWKLKPTVVNSK